MKVRTACIVLVASVAMMAGPVSAAKLQVSFTDSSWTGKKIPKGQHCRKFGGDGATPELKVSGIPEGTTAIFVEFNDASYQPLSNRGGHGIVGFEYAGAAKRSCRRCRVARTRLRSARGSRRRTALRAHGRRPAICRLARAATVTATSPWSRPSTRTRRCWRRRRSSWVDTDAVRRFNGGLNDTRRHSGRWGDAPRRITLCLSDVLIMAGDQRQFISTAMSTRAGCACTLPRAGPSRARRRSGSTGTGRTPRRAPPRPPRSRGDTWRSRRRSR